MFYFGVSNRTFIYTSCTLSFLIFSGLFLYFINTFGFFSAKALLGLKTRAKVALDYMIIEAVFAGMFHLPRPPVQHGNLLFYGSLLVQLCHEASNTIPLVLAQATEVLFERLDNMKPVCIGR